jgi:hypothetical protein
MTKILIFKHHRANSDTVRYRICQILHKTLKSINSNQSISNDLYKTLQICLIERMKDIKEEVQIEAIKCLTYLQDPCDRDCPTIAAFIFILKHNGLNVKSRLRILDMMALNRQTFAVIKDLIYNPEVDIRLKAYDLLIERVSLKFFNENYKINFVKCLFKEEEYLSKLYLNKLLVRWLEKVENNYLKFITLFNLKKFYDVGLEHNLINFIYMAFDLNIYDCSIQDKFLNDCGLKLVIVF